MLSHRIRPVSEILAPHVEHLWMVRGYLPTRWRNSDHPRDLRRSDNCGRSNSRTRQESSGQINQHEPNEKRSVGNCTNQYKHGYRCAAHELTFFFKKVWSILKRLAILGNFCGQTTEEKL
jgi:hypothetical protein